MVTLALEKVYYSTLWKVRAIVGEVEAEVAVEVQIGVDILRGVKVKAGVEAPKKVLAIEEVVHLVEAEVVLCRTRVRDIFLVVHPVHVHIQGLALLQHSDQEVGVYPQIGWTTNQIRKPSIAYLVGMIVY